MYCDVFNRKQARSLLEGKKIWFIGSSNMRAIYKDVLWLLQHECLASQITFKVKNEPTYLNDKLLSNDTLHNGRNYMETREYKSKQYYIFFHFITRLYQDHFIKLIEGITPETAPDVIFLNSCLWDLSRWGPDGPKQFRENIMRTMKFLKSELPAKTRVIWKTSLPVSTSADGAIFVDEIKFIVPMLPWHLLEANAYAATCASFFSYDTLDFHHFMRMQGHLRVKDGIHWQPIAIRYLTNAFLTHLCLCWGRKLPGNFVPNERYLSLTTKITVQESQIKERVNKKDGFFKKLFAKVKKGHEKKKDGPLSGIKNLNKIFEASKNIFKRKKKSRGKGKIKSVGSVNGHDLVQEVASSYKYQYSNEINSNDFVQNNSNNFVFPQQDVTINNVPLAANSINNYAFASNNYNYNINAYPLLTLASNYINSLVCGRPIYLSREEHYRENNYYSQYYNFPQRK